MKKIALCLALASIYGTAQANGLYIDPISSEFAIAGYDGGAAAVTGTKTIGVTGTLKTNRAGRFQATYLGQESGFLDGFRFVVEGSELNEASALGSTIQKWVNPGVVNFQFFDSKGALFDNGNASGPTLGYAFLKENSGFGEDNIYGSFQYLLGFNDSSKSDADYDDYVVGVNLVPVPAALPLMASALGLIGVGMRRRKTQ